MQAAIDYPTVDGVAILSLDNPPVNSLSGAQRARINAMLQHAAARSDVQAIVITGKNGVFCGGADVREFNTPAQRLSPIMPELIEGCDKIDKVIVAAIEGFSYGAGLEFAIAMHYRVAQRGAKLGLPEVKFGFLPDAGGTQRLPRLVPMAKAADMMLNGSAIGAEEAHRLGLVDVLADENVLEAAITFARSKAGQLRRTRDLQARTEDMAPNYLKELRAKVEAGAQGNIAKLHIVDCCSAAIEKPFDEALAFERERFLAMLGTPESKALRHVFFAERSAAKVSRVGAEVVARPVDSAAVIGAGTMGSGIAICFADAGIPVTLIDAKPESLERGRAHIAKVYEAKVAKGRMTAAERDAVLSLITPGTSLEDTADVDIVVEAVFEDFDLKCNIFRQLSKVTKPGAILATNTSMLDVNAIAAATSRPQDVIGMHFFSPANIMRLLEVVDCEKTAGDVLLTAMQLSRRLGKVPVASGVCDGFIGNRMLQKYLQQALFLLDEGCSPQQIDGAVQDWGMAMGPLAVGDLSGLDIGWSIRKRRYIERPDMVYSRIADRICEAGRLGQKTGKGWYRYDPGQRKPIPDPEAEAILAAYRSEHKIPQRAVSDEEIVQRLMFALVNEGAAILREGIAQRASDVDVVYITGYGYPATKGGPMFFANELGPDKVLEAMRRFQQGYQGSQWQPDPLLVSLAEQGKKFGE